MTLLTSLYLLNGQEAIMAVVATAQAQTENSSAEITLNSLGETYSSQQSNISAQLSLNVFSQTEQSNTAILQLFIQVAMSVTTNNSQSNVCFCSQYLDIATVSSQVQTISANGVQTINSIGNTANTNTNFSTADVSVSLTSTTEQSQTSILQATEQIFAFTEGHTTQTVLSDAYLIFTGVETSSTQGTAALATMQMLGNIGTSNINTNNTQMFIRYDTICSTSQSQILSALVNIGITVVGTSSSTQTSSFNLSLNLTLSNESAQSNTVLTTLSQELLGYNISNTTQSLTSIGYQQSNGVINTEQSQSVLSNATYSYIGHCETTVTNSCFIPCDITIVYYNNKTPRPILKDPVYMYQYSAPNYTVKTQEVPQTQQHALPVIKTVGSPTPQEDLKIVMMTPTGDPPSTSFFKVRDIPPDNNEYVCPIIYPP